MAPQTGGRPGSSRRVRLVPIRRRALDHRAVARIVLALAREMTAEAESAAQLSANDAISSRAATGSSSEASDPATTPCSGAHHGSSRKVHGVASVGRCMAEKSEQVSPGSYVAGQRSHQRHDGAHRSPHENAAPSSTPGGTP